MLRHFGTQLDWGATTRVAIQSDEKAVLLSSSFGSFSLTQLATDGTVDRRFGRDGFAVGAFGIAVGEPAADEMAFAPDGKILVGGSGGEVDFVISPFAVARYLPDGNLDDTFGTDGNMVFAGVPPVEYGAEALLPLPGGKVFVVGRTGDRLEAIEAARLNRDGSIDRAFGNRGFSVVPIPEWEYGGTARAALAGDQPIVMFPMIHGFTLIRFHATGELDKSFGGDGTVVSKAIDQASEFAIQADGRIVVTGPHEVTRLLPDGRPDPTFTTSDLAKLTPNPLVLNVRPEILPDGKILLAGETPDRRFLAPGTPDFLVVRLNADGSVDSTFGAGRGYVTTDGPGAGEDTVYDVAPLPDGGLLAVGRAYTPPVPSSTLAARYGSDGSLVKSFAADGILNLPIRAPGRNEAVALLADRDGSVTAAVVGGVGFGLVRYQVSGGRDHGFGNDGFVQAAELGGGSRSRGRCLARYPDGRFLVGGTSRQGPVLSRYLPDGRLDRGFGIDGLVRLGSLNTVLSVRIGRDRSIIAAGFVAHEAVLIRLSPKGRPDRNFGRDGSVKVPDQYRNSRSVVLAIRRDGRILVGGGASHSYLAEFTSDGVPIRSFGESSSLGSARGLPAKLDAIAVDRSGRILVAGTLRRGRDFGLVRLRRNGTPDPTFGSGGLVRTVLQPAKRASVAALAIEPNGKIVAVGTRQHRCGARCLRGVPTVVRYRPDGSRDPNFGRAGIWTRRIGPSAGLTSVILTKRGIVAGGWRSSFGQGRDLMLLRLHR